MMQYTSILALAGLISLSVAGSASAQVVFPESPAHLVAMLDDDALEMDPAYRAFMREAVSYVLSREADADDKPYTEAVQGWLQSEIGYDARALQMFRSAMVTSMTVSGPIDLYLLMGQSNMVGVTESGDYHGPDETIRAALQAVTTDRTVVTLNCALSGSFLAWWEPHVPWFTDPFVEDRLRHNLTRACIESARSFTNIEGDRAHIRGIFFYQGESDVLLAANFDSAFYVDSWPERYAEIVDFLRIEFGDVPAVHAQIAVYDHPDPLVQGYWAQLQSRQVEVPSIVPRSAMIVTSDLTTHDGVHLDVASQIVAGERFAQAMIGLLNECSAP